MAGVVMDFNSNDITIKLIFNSNYGFQVLMTGQFVSIIIAADTMKRKQQLQSFLFFYSKL